MAALLACACAPVGSAVHPGGTASIGSPSKGVLVDGLRMATDTEGRYAFYRKLDRRYALPELVRALETAAARVAQEAPGSRLLVGDLSKPGGGFASEHRSHRSGRDADLAFFATDPAGEPVSGAPLVRYDRYGVAVRDERAVSFDARRNWLAVEALLEDPDAEIQWIFVSDGLKALLLEWALNNGRDEGTILKAASILHQPSDSAPHDDHFHVRIYCPRGDDAHRCTDGAPIWPWVSGRENPASTISDERLVALALEGL